MKNHTDAASWQRQTWKLLSQYLRPHWRRMLVLGLLIAVGTGLELLGPQILTWAIDAATAGTTAGRLGWLGLFYILATVARRAAQGSTEYAAADLGWLATNHLRGDLTRHVLTLPMQFHTEFTAGQLAERIDGDVGALRDFFSQFLVRVLINVSVLFGVTAVLFVKDWRIGLIFLTSSALTVLAYRRLSTIAVPASHAERQAESELMGVMEEDLRGAEDARPLGATPYLLERLFRAARKHLIADARRAPLARVPLAAVMVIMGLNEAAGLLVGVRLIEAGVLTVGFVYLVVQYNNIVSWPLRQLGWQLGSLQTAGASVARISDVLSREPEDALPPPSPSQPPSPSSSPSPSVLSSEEAKWPQLEARRLPPGPLGVRFENVRLAYPDGPPVLKGLTFTLPPGRTLGIVGRTGGGKSSLARLLLRLYEPTDGSIVFFDADESGQCQLRDIPRTRLRREVSMVTQDVQLFAANVGDNLTLFGALEDITDERLTRALENVGLGPWLRQLPQGLSTPLLEGEAGLSAGQAQLLALARVFLRDPRIVLLDEASSRLDRSTQAMLDQAVDRLLAGRTAIIIAHRLSTLERVDHILVLEEGEVTEFGDRAVLAADPTSRFYALLHTSDQRETQEELA